MICIPRSAHLFRKEMSSLIAFRVPPVNGREIETLRDPASSTILYILRALLDAGASPRLIDPDCGVSALDEAVRSRSHTCTRYLLDALPNSPAVANILRNSLNIDRQENNSRAAKLIEKKLATVEYISLQNGDSISRQTHLREINQQRRTPTD